MWSGSDISEFGALTSKYMSATTQALRSNAMTVVNTIGDPCIGGEQAPKLLNGTLVVACGTQEADTGVAQVCTSQAAQV